MTVTEFRHAESGEDVLACFPVIRQLRRHLRDETEFLARVRRQKVGGYRLLAAWEGDHVIGAAGYRLQENLIRGPFAYVDDLVVREDKRRDGTGTRLLNEVARAAKAAGCGWMTLDTDLANVFAQRFYFRWGLLSSGLHFGIALS